MSESAYSERVEKFSVIHEQLTAEAEAARCAENNQRLTELVKAGALPYFSNYHPDGYNERKGDEYGLWSDYGLQLFFSTGEKILSEGLSESETIRLKAATERDLAQGNGKPSTSDGGKGQWRAALKYRIKSCEWFLGEREGTEWMENDKLYWVPDDAETPSDGENWKDVFL